ncbi:hypothetical protein BIV60_15400 [Bacillus sp. MUM 116]|uniref:hypothetical protein n=1 Tax=Bacillus sp. MUM 116 TaxID=1678002 RepID=UPI0008F5AFE7|nr:hypothetical protein [Bacillus sp. MUM 116]OIK12908.1 hypothetical protein BIV60_15400 [Bacillus sp. MUM 116]
MRKSAFLVSMCLLLFFLTSCSQTSNQSSKKASSSSTSTNLKNTRVFKGQDVSDITKLHTPDELVYLHNGISTMITKKNPKFQKILQLNNSRQTKKLNALKLVVDYKITKKNGDYLVYLYDTKNYVPVCFDLVPSPDEGFENFVGNYYGSDAVPSDDKVIRTNINAFGHLAPADKLLAYLKS